MKLSALLVLGAFACASLAQSNPALYSDRNLTVDDQALSHAAAAMAPSARLKDLNQMMDRISQAKCPVQLTSARLTPHLMLLHTVDDSMGNGLDLEFLNTSGKQIRSMEFSATILVKKSKYDLDYQPPIRVYLTAYGTRTVDETFAQLQRLSLPDDVHPTLVQGITLEQVVFADGSVWTPVGNQYCGLKPGQTLPVAR